MRHLDASRCPCGRPRALLYLFGRVCWGAGTARESRAFIVAEVYSFVVLRALPGYVTRLRVPGDGRAVVRTRVARSGVAPVGESRVAGEPDRTVRRVYATRTRRVALGFCIEYSVLIISLFDSYGHAGVLRSGRRVSRSRPPGRPDHRAPPSTRAGGRIAIPSCPMVADPDRCAPIYATRHIMNA